MRNNPVWGKLVAEKDLFSKKEKKMYEISGLLG